MPDLDKSELLALWLDDQLNDQQRAEFERLCAEDDAFAAQVEAANMVTMQAESYQPAAVPNWQRDAAFQQPEKKAWWQWQGLPGLSFATSMMAIVMVLTGVNVQVKDGAMTVQLGQPDTTPQVEALVAKQLADFQMNQQQALTSYAQALQTQQLEANTQLTNYLLTSSRQERREDFAELIKFVNQQRNDDQLFYARQLNKLQTQIFTDTDQNTWPDGKAITDLDE